MDGSDFLDDGYPHEDIDRLVKSKLQSIQYREKVQEKFASMSSNFDKIVPSSMKDTQRIFDEILENVDAVQAEQKMFRKELNSYIGGDVIVLTDDDDEKPEPPKSLKVENRADVVKQQNQTIPAPSNFSAVIDSVSDNQLPDPYGLTIGQRVLGMRHRAEWFPGTIIDIRMHKGKNRYKVRFDRNRGKMRLTANHLARIETALRYGVTQVPAGSRVAAHYHYEGIFSGIVAEAPDRRMNQGRFLIFFDDGYTMYCATNSVYLVYGAPANVWEDISYRLTADYVKEYLQASEHPLLTLRTNQALRVEFKGEWHDAKCANVDSSLVEVMYLIDNSREWIYRGSLRLEPLYKQHQAKNKAILNKSQRRIARAHTGVRTARVEYATIDLTRDSSPSPTASPTRPVTNFEGKKKNIGKKSTGGVPRNQSMLTDTKPKEKRWPWERRPSVGSASTTSITKLPQSYSELQGGVDIASSILNRMEQSPQKNNQNHEKNDDVMLLEDTSSDFSWRKRKAALNNASHRVSKAYVKHNCSRKCVERYKLSNPLKLFGKNPLEKPLNLGWTREVSKKHPSSAKGSSFHIYYKTPCGRTCRNMKDIDKYLIETGLTDLDYTQFCFDHSVRIYSNIDVRPRFAKFYMDDYSGGKETVPIPCVNEISTERPPKMPYTKQRVPGIGVKIETSSEYMVCCDCPDNCRDRSKCPCQQLTVTATSCCKGGKIRSDAGYVYKRLYNFLPTGIYECNPKCKCNTGCPNRVVQHGLQCRLQMFKTHKKGWGIRCLDDIAKGTFVCIYTGKIQNEEQANKDGLANGDEYLAELDHIEVAERQKDVDDAASSSGISDIDEFDDDKKIRTPKTKSDDSGAETTDSDSVDEMSRTKHVTVTLKRDSDSRWIVEHKPGQYVHVEGDNHPAKYGTAKKNFSNGHKKTKNVARLLDDSGSESGSAIARSLAPPKRNDDDMDDDTTDTDTDSSSHDNSRSPSTGLGSNKRHDTSSQNIRLNSSHVSDDDDGSISQTRKYFGTADTFIIDAKQIGNLGRYLNHSCSPNLLVQNVFIDTHDLRFPWVAFFASSTIRAGTELTWDYNYEIGSVEGREIVCYCGATKCRKRLL